MKLSGNWAELRSVSYVGIQSTIKSAQECDNGGVTCGCKDPGRGYAEGSGVGETVVVIGPIAIFPTWFHSMASSSLLQLYCNAVVAAETLQTFVAYPEGGGNVTEGIDELEFQFVLPRAVAADDNSQPALIINLLETTMAQSNWTAADLRVDEATQIGGTESLYLLQTGGSQGLRDIMLHVPALSG